jgi:hypothetical protein
MKKILFLYFLIMLLNTTVCLAQGKKEFDSDPRIRELIDIVDSFRKVKPSETQIILGKKDQIDRIITGINSDYGIDKVDSYIKINIGSNNTSGFVPYGDGDKCHRNSNGTVNWDDCNFWETVAVIFASIGCPQPYPGGGSPQDQGERYYKCLQDVICKRC